MDGNLGKLDLGIEREGGVNCETQWVCGDNLYWTGNPENNPMNSGPDMLGHRVGSWEDSGGDWNALGLELGRAL